MSTLKSPLTFRVALENSCVFLSILSAVVLLIVWALADTIAARNISIYVGLLTSTAWILLESPKITRYDLLVPALLMGVPIWLWVIYFFFPIDPAAQFKEMTGTWLRVMLLIIFGFNLGLMISRNSKLALVIWLALACIPAAALIVYFNEVYNRGYWDIPKYTGFFKTKVAATYFLMWPYLLGCAGIFRASIDLLSGKSIRVLSKFVPPLILVSVCLYLFSVFNTLTGLLISSLILALILIFFLRIIFYSNFKKNKLRALVIGFLLISPILILNAKNISTQNSKISYIIEDILISMQLNSNTSWKYQGDLTPPMDKLGRRVNGSAYERTSWLLKGYQYLAQHPFGSGDAHFSFGRYMEHEYPGSATTKTHSGWLDFSLGVGIPGLIFLWAAIFIVFSNSWRNAVSNDYRFNFLAVAFMLGGIWLLWHPGELSYREFIEHLFFLVALFASINFLRNK